ncbi:MAG: manganese-dependent inorganic pyrophosphatase [Candidatus Magasanikbacteria bacterium]|nr:manganese-dependent inorganic pyrophosphatase [Candidatus Magasanikbacteria bacterium]
MKHIFGHKNPDTDSICSAIAYADFLNKQNIDAKAFALGSLNKETQFVLEYFGIEAPEQIDKLPAGTEVILVDHNEEKQSIDKIKDLDIVEIIDHHNLKIETNKPISVLFKPVGSTCTIIAEEKYFKNNVELTKPIAGILLSALISDTLFFHSPTTTDIDKVVAEKLSKIAEVENLEEFSLKLFNAKSDLGDISVEKLIKLDYKTYDFKDGTYSIGVMETTNAKFGLDKKEDILIKLKELKESEDLSGIFFTIIDILNEESYTFTSGDTEDALFTKLFSAVEKNNALYVDKLISRKKQIVPVFEKM